MSPFENACAREPVANEIESSILASRTWSLRFTSDWHQGRGAYGGLVAAHFAEAFSSLAPGRTARTLNVSFCAPAVDECRLTATIERKGAGVTFLSARLWGRRRDEWSPVATASGTWGVARPTIAPILLGDSPPKAPPPASIPPLEQVDGWPSFARHFDYRPCLGARVFSGSASGQLGGHIRAVEPAEPSLAYICGLLDAWPPALLTTLRQPVPAASLDFSYQFFTDFPLAGIARDAWYLYFADSDVMRDGYCEERASLWSESGELLARVRQNIMVFG